MDYTYNYILITSLESWYIAFSKRCSRCEKQIDISKRGEHIVYQCKECKSSFSYYYLDLEEKYLEETFINLLMKQYKLLN